MWSILCIDHIRHLVCIECYFLVPHTHVLCMGSGSATGFFYQVRLVHSLVKYIFKFQLWYWIQIYTTKYSNLLLIILILVWLWIVCSTYRKGEILMQKWHMSPANLFTVTCHTKWSRSGRSSSTSKFNFKLSHIHNTSTALALNRYIAFSPIHWYLCLVVAYRT